MHPALVNLLIIFVAFSNLAGMEFVSGHVCCMMSVGMPEYNFHFQVTIVSGRPAGPQTPRDSPFSSFHLPRAARGPHNVYDSSWGLLGF